MSVECRVGLLSVSERGARRSRRGALRGRPSCGDPLARHVRELALLADLVRDAECVELLELPRPRGSRIAVRGHELLAARLAVLAASPNPGVRVLDACAAPGGKSFAAAIAMRGQGSILSCDIHEKKLRRIVDGAERLGLAHMISTRAMDARGPGAELSEAFDLTIADVPCSGIGVIRKKPEIRFKKEAELERLPQIQLDILRGLASTVRHGGTLLYSTCTVLKNENEGTVETFLAENSGFEKLYERTLFPHTDGTDGFFMAKLRKHL